MKNEKKINLILENLKIAYNNILEITREYDLYKYYTEEGLDDLNYIEVSLYNSINILEDIENIEDMEEEDYE